MGQRIDLLFTPTNNKSTIDHLNDYLNLLPAHRDERIYGTPQYVASLVIKGFKRYLENPKKRSSELKEGSYF